MINMKFSDYITVKNKVQGIRTFSAYEAIKDVLNQGGTIDYAAWNKVYVADLFSDIRFPKGKIYEDMHIMPKLFSRCERIVQIDKPLYYYRQREKKYNKFSIFGKNLDIISAYEIF